MVQECDSEYWEKIYRREILTKRLDIIIEEYLGPGSVTGEQSDRDMFSTQRRFNDVSCTFMKVALAIQPFHCF
jgi:hypothetical protein